MAVGKKILSTKLFFPYMTHQHVQQYRYTTDICMNMMEVTRERLYLNQTFLNANL